jgi:hypothetical protein
LKASNLSGSLLNHANVPHAISVASFLKAEALRYENAETKNTCDGSYPADIERKLDQIRIFEIKSTKKKLSRDFSKYFFALTAAEVLVAQSLKKYFRFAFVNTVTGDYLELSLIQIFSRAKGIYPTWSICF